MIVPNGQIHPQKTRPNRNVIDISKSANSANGANSRLAMLPVSQINGSNRRNRSPPTSDGHANVTVSVRYTNRMKKTVCVAVRRQVKAFR